MKAVMSIVRANGLMRATAGVLEPTVKYHPSYVLQTMARRVISGRRRPNAARRCYFLERTARRCITQRSDLEEVAAGSGVSRVAGDVSGSLWTRSMKAMKHSSTFSLGRR